MLMTPAGKQQQPTMQVLVNSTIPTSGSRSRFDLGATEPIRSEMSPIVSSQEENRIPGKKKRRRRRKDKSLFEVFHKIK